MKLEDLTKEELISLINHSVIIGRNITERDILRAKWYSLSDKAAEKRERSLAAGKTGDWASADTYWKQAESIQKEADSVLEKMGILV